MRRRARAQIAPCADALAAKAGGKPYVIDDIADWAVRPVDLTIYLADLSGLPDPEPPSLIGWADAVHRARADGRTVLQVRLEDGRATVRDVKGQPPGWGPSHGVACKSGERGGEADVGQAEPG